MPCVAFAGLSVPPLARERALHPPATLLPASRPISPPVSVCMRVLACACACGCREQSFVGWMLAVEERVLERAFANKGRVLVRRVMVPLHISSHIQ